MRHDIRFHVSKKVLAPSALLPLLAHLGNLWRSSIPSGNGGTCPVAGELGLATRLCIDHRGDSSAAARGGLEEFSVQRSAL
jgi:hypothetical protein